MKLSKDITGLNIKISNVEGLVLSSPYGDNKVFGQPKGLKSIGIIKITLQDGTNGYGETYSGIYAPELISPIANFYGKKITGIKLKNLIYNIDKYFDIPFIGFNGLMQSIKSAFSVALFDCLSRHIEIPIYKLFNKNLKPIRVYVSGGSVVYKSDEIYKDAENLKSKGFDLYKMRIGHQGLETDLKRIKSAIKVFGDDNFVIVDLIQGTLKSNYLKEDYYNIFKELNNFNLAWVEEPTEPWRIEFLAYIKSFSKNKLATGEAYSGYLSFKQLIIEKFIDIIQYDITHSGDFNTCFNISQLAIKNKIDQILHVWGSSLSLHSNAILCLINENIKLLEYPSVKFKLSDDIKSVNHRIKNGYLIFDNDFLGTGVEIDDNKINSYPFVEGTGYSI